MSYGASLLLARQWTTFVDPFRTFRADQRFPAAVISDDIPVSAMGRVRPGSL
jgi:hypothetical protein